LKRRLRYFVRVFTGERGSWERAAVATTNFVGRGTGKFHPPDRGREGKESFPPEGGKGGLNHLLF